MRRGQGRGRRRRTWGQTRRAARDAARGTPPAALPRRRSPGRASLTKPRRPEELLRQPGFLLASAAASAAGGGHRSPAHVACVRALPRARAPPRTTRALPPRPPPRRLPARGAGGEERRVWPPTPPGPRSGRPADPRPAPPPPPAPPRPGPGSAHRAGPGRRAAHRALGRLRAHSRFIHPPWARPAGEAAPRTHPSNGCARGLGRPPASRPAHRADGGGPRLRRAGGAAGAAGAAPAAADAGLRPGGAGRGGRGGAPGGHRPKAPWRLPLANQMRHRGLGSRCDSISN